MQLSNQLIQLDALIAKHSNLIPEVVDAYLSDENMVNQLFHQFPEKKMAFDECLDWYQNLLQLMESNLDVVLKDVSKQFSITQKLLEGLKHADEYYLNNMHPFVVQYLVWLYLHDREFVIKYATTLHSAAIYGTLGYRILDLAIDEGKQNTSEMRLMSMYMIQKYEDHLLNCFGHTAKNQHQLSQIKYMLINEELRQLQCKYKANCYQINDLKQMADKAVHLFAPFALGLIRFNKQELYTSYWDIFRCTFAPIQLIDDVQDVEEDVREGHYSVFQSHKNPFSKMEEIPVELIHQLYAKGIELFTEARELCKSINDPVFLLNIEKTRLRFNTTFLALNNQ